MTRAVLIALAWLLAGGASAVAQGVGDTPVDPTDPASTEPITDPSVMPTEASDQRPTPAELGQAQYSVLLPGCAQPSVGAFVCDSVIEFQHCRTLMIGQLAYSCEADVAFAADLAVPRLAASDEYSLILESDARVRVRRGDRGGGQIRGNAELELEMQTPDIGESCLQQNSLVYFPTGPDGGTSEIGDPDECGMPVELSFEPHEDDLIRAYDICEAFAAWGSNIDESFGVLVAVLFHVRSGSAEFFSAFGNDAARIAPYIEIAAPLDIDCRD